ncbi:acVLRF1 family peptidyl-tRNA hydrolase [Actinopolymorpha sp. NPDC004070]|uniref:acVLRF1 family peptidyl-tRNA hydrolase n=1 Tax=Actinopolymorpha sp. NPDC004070 TaxID=3154548 RepID=UPI00339E019E
MPSASTSDAASEPVSGPASGPASGVGETTRELTVGPERLDRWLAGFLTRHGGPAAGSGGADAPAGECSAGGSVEVSADGTSVTVYAADGARVEGDVPFPPLVPPGGSDPAPPYAGLVAHATRERTVGVVLVRMGGYAAGVFDGAVLRTSKVGSRLVQGRTAAGGWSQQRFARRREKQAREAFAAAADVAARVVLPHLSDLAAVVVGGDRRAVGQVLQDPRLAPLRALVTGPHLDVPDPKLAVLRATPERFRAVRLRLIEPDPPAPSAEPDRTA